MSFQVAFLRDSPPPLCTTRRRLRAKPTGSAWDGEMPRHHHCHCHCVSLHFCSSDKMWQFGDVHSSFFKIFLFKDILYHTEFAPTLQLFPENVVLKSRSLKILEGSERVTKGGCDRSLITQTRFAPRIRTIPFLRCVVSCDISCETPSRATHGALDDPPKGMQRLKAW